MNDSLNSYIRITLFLCVCLFSSPPVSAWGNRGHHQICEAATFLVSEAGLKSFVRERSHRLGYLCNVPDTYWRDLAAEQTRVGNPTHFINPETINQELGKISKDYAALVAAGAKPEKLGSIWWRANQFVERATGFAKQAKRAAPPKNTIEEQKHDLDYNVAVFEMLQSLGLLGHFVGDVSMPFHNRVDYDGRASGHGGIHGFYEETCVDEFPPDLTAQIVNMAQSLKDEEFLKPKVDVVTRMRAMSLRAVAEAVTVEALDLVLQPSTDQVRVAKRKSVAEACPAFRELTLVQLARSARLLALLWDEAYRAGGRPQLAAYKSYRYPFLPTFIVPDYSPAP